MEKRKKSIFEKLPPARLFLDDINEIVGIFKEISNDVEIETEDYKLEDVSEMRNLNSDYINELMITSHQPYLTLRFEPYKAYFHSSEDTLIVRGALEKIRKIFSTKPNRLLNFYNNYIIKIIYNLLPIISGGMLGYGFISISENKNYYIFIYTGILLLLITLATSWQRASLRNKYSVIYLFNEKDRKSFWKRNQDSIISGIIGSLFVAIMAWFASELIKIVPWL